MSGYQCWRRQKRVWPLLTEESVAELQTVESCNMDAGNPTQVLWKTIQCPSTLSYPSQGFPWEIPEFVLLLQLC